MQRALGTGLILALTALSAERADAIDLCGSGPRITCVVDGDTIWYQGENIRMLGYDTPEPQTGICGGQREIRLATQATQRLLDILNSGASLTIERNGTDRYGRTLATIRTDGADVGDILVAEGLARYWPDGCEFWCGGC